MSTKANYFKIGIFVLGGLVLGLVAVVVLGTGVFFRQTVTAESYFTDSIQGLDIGSKVTFRGVRIGNVEEISMVQMKYPTRHPYVYVRMAIRPEWFQAMAQQKGDEALAREVEQGLRVRLVFQGVTGTAFLEADYFDPQQFPPIPIDWQPHHAYIPSSPSLISRLGESADTIMKTIEEIDLPGIATALSQSLQALGKILEEGRIGAAGQQAEALLSELRQTNEQISRFLEHVPMETLAADISTAAAGIRRMTEKGEDSLVRFLEQSAEAATTINRLAGELERSGDLVETAARFQQAARRFDRMLADSRDDVESAVENFRRASEDLRAITESAREYPAHFLFGEPPPPPESRRP